MEGSIKMVTKQVSSFGFQDEECWFKSCLNQKYHFGLSDAMTWKFDYMHWTRHHAWLNKHSHLRGRKKERKMPFKRPNSR